MVFFVINFTFKLHLAFRLVWTPNPFFLGPRREAAFRILLSELGCLIPWRHIASVLFQKLAVFKIFVYHPKVFAR